jgi:PDDEXK-like domain of unknown function (DUF3799)
MAAIVDKPGVYVMDEAVYHGDPVVGGSLSCSGAKLIIPPGCPAVFDHARRNPRPATKAMELGTAAHREVLGVGWEYKVGEWESYTTNAAREWAKDCRASGIVPLKPSEREQIVAMADAIRAHPNASLLLQAEEVMAEHSFFWQDEEFGIWRRSRFDSVRLAGSVLITDYKTAVSADPWEFARQAANLRYHMQDPYYREAVTHVLGDAYPQFVFVVQEKDPPYLVGIFDLPVVAVERGMELNREACRVFARCQAAGEWPGYQPGEIVTTLDWPRWAS